MEYQEQPLTFDEWRSGREEKGKLITTDKPGGETNTDLNPLLPTTTPTNTAHQPPNNGFRHGLSDNTELLESTSMHFPIRYLFSFSPVHHRLMPASDRLVFRSECLIRGIQT